MSIKEQVLPLADKYAAICEGDGRNDEPDSYYSQQARAALVAALDAADQRMLILTTSSSAKSVIAQKAFEEIDALLAENAKLISLITKLHSAKGRYHTQLAACDLFDAVGLKNDRPNAARAALGGGDAAEALRKELK